MPICSPCLSSYSYFQCRPIPPPPKTLAPRSGALFMVPVGHINHTIPVTKAALAKGGSKATRQPGSPAYMKPKIEFNTSSVLFLYYDASGRNIAPEHIDFFDHYDLDEAKFASVVAWDSQERTRIHGHNMKWVVFWTRLRLARYLLADDRNMQAPTNLVQWANVQVESKEIVRLRLCIDVLTKQAAFAAAVVEKLGATRGGGITLA
ncbi:hypothetical protein CONLIGDRAFT_16521 [Coniochaeta ligniaria NRRL 30616]|uniref:Uncharacterized protein n=1 Tax=Coniochaeta ligniaria NRRL 30616 TaxID=1408157 RepID=A0A1J7J3N8_9PEZI|nr:hypothetical protein CONLIGDRAFT_16521 [Coniochaeta ligniaria NRRL 30616]